MAPTTILAIQVAKKLAQFLEPYGISSELLIGSVSKKEKERINHELLAGTLQVVVGTQALIQESVQYHALGYVIIDEQHRFGVEQREKLSEYTSNLLQREYAVLQDVSSRSDTLTVSSVQDEETPHHPLPGKLVPHVLQMTATPIPRTLSMALYGNQDISIISEYPAHHKHIVTHVTPSGQAHDAYRWIEQELEKGHQAYWISPLVEESEKIEALSVHETAEKLHTLFPGRRIGILHGRMKPDQKDVIMQDFIAGNYDILSATSVVEV
jgi:ATP-dependent DNA helicase RecG